MGTDLTPTPTLFECPDHLGISLNSQTAADTCGGYIMSVQQINHPPHSKLGILVPDWSRRSGTLVLPGFWASSGMVAMRPACYGMGTLELHEGHLQGYCNTSPSGHSILCGTLE